MKSVVVFTFILLSLSFAASVATADLSNIQTQWETASKANGNKAVIDALNTKAVNKGLLQWVLEQDADRVEDLADKAVKQYPNAAQLWYLRGRIHANQASKSVFSALSHAKKALSSFQQASSLNPEEVVYLNGVFGFYLNAPSIAGGDIEKAEAIARDTISIDPRSGYYNLLALAYSKGLPEKDDWIAEANEKVGALPEFTLVEGNQYLREKEYDKAATLFEMVGKNTNNDDKSREFKLIALFQLGRTAASAERYSLEAQQALERFVASNESFFNLPSKEWGEVYLAELYLLNNNKNGAETRLNRIDVKHNNRLAKKVKALRKRLN